MSPVAVVMNMFYTGLGIARSLGEHGIPVIGLTAHRGIYGNFTRYAALKASPDSREDPEALLAFLISLGEELAGRVIIFPTRDDDLIFLDRYRAQLDARFTLALPERVALEACLDKSETYRCAQAARIPAPRCWTIAGKQDLLRILAELTFPCVLKPVSASHWRKQRNWQMVGSRKAISASSPAELMAEYDSIARAESRALLQEQVPGGDDCLFVAACYMNRRSEFVAGFTAQKLIQVPERFGTGCIVQTVSRPELLVTAATLLRQIGFAGIAEVEFKRDPSSGVYKLIEINPRSWDQHRLGNACGVDLIHIAYCDLLGLAHPPVSKQRTGQKWIAEDVYFLVLLRSLVRRDGKFRSLLQAARGERVYAIWSKRDPLPWLGFVVMRYGVELIKSVPRFIKSLLQRLARERSRTKAGERYDKGLEKA